LKSMLEVITCFFFLFFQFCDIENLKFSFKTLAKLVKFTIEKKFPTFFFWKATIFVPKTNFCWHLGSSWLIWLTYCHGWHL
jgi:hypothetical protein